VKKKLKESAAALNEVINHRQRNALSVSGPRFFADRVRQVKDATKVLSGRITTTDCPK